MVKIVDEVKINKVKVANIRVKEKKFNKEKCLHPIIHGLSNPKLETLEQYVQDMEEMMEKPLLPG